jgi:hypothetical protein
MKNLMTAGLTDKNFFMQDGKINPGAMMAIKNDIQLLYSIATAEEPKSDLSRVADYTWTLASNSTTIVNQNIAIGDNEMYYFEYYARANASGTCDMYLLFNGTSRSTSNYDSGYQYNGLDASDECIFAWTNSTSKYAVTCGHIKKIGGYACAWGDGLRGGTTGIGQFFIRKLAAGNISSIQVKASATVKAGAKMQLWKV